MEKLFAAAENFVRERLSALSDGHDLDHTRRVVHHAMMLCDALPEADRDLVHLAALLHDAARPEEAASCGKVDHAAVGAQLAHEFLLAQGAAPELAERTAQCIAEHRYRSTKRPSTLEAQILFDADKLDSLGAVGLARSFLFAGKVGARVHNTREEALNSPAYGREDTAYREYLVKLSKLPDAMQTEAARQKARELCRFMEAFFAELDAETLDGTVKKC